MNWKTANPANSPVDDSREMSSLNSSENILILILLLIIIKNNFRLICYKCAQCHMGNEYTFKGGNLQNCSCFPSEYVLVYKESIRSPRAWESYLLTCAPNEDSNQLAHPHSLIRVFVEEILHPWLQVYKKYAKRRFWSDCANAQADLNFRQAHVSDGTFYDVSAYICTCRNTYCSLCYL